MNQTAQADPLKDGAFRKLRLRLAFAYIGIFSAILTIILAAVYQTIAYKLNQRLSDHVFSLASSSAQTLEIIEHEYEDLLKAEAREKGRAFGKQWVKRCKQERGDEWKEKCRKEWRKKWREQWKKGWKDNDIERKEQWLNSVIQNDSSFSEDLSLPSGSSDLNEDNINSDNSSVLHPLDQAENHPKQQWVKSINQLVEDRRKSKTNPSRIKVIKQFRAAPQSIEWFDKNQKLLVREGILEIEPLSNSKIPPEGLTQFSSSHLSLTLPVYLSSGHSEKSELIGYVRSTASREGIKKDLRDIQLALALGYIAALGLTVLCGNWLTTQALSPLAKNVEQLQQFTSDAAHELRTPLTVINGAVQLLFEGSAELSSQEIQKLGLIADASQEMKSLVNQLLLLARLDSSGTQALDHWLSIPVDEILSDLVSEYETSARERKIALNHEPFAPCNMEGNAEQIKSLFSNLIGNALQYTLPGGSVTVLLTQDDDSLIVQVADTGIGITSDNVPKIFERFWRADQSRSHHTAGAGLGLAICRSVAHRHGGEILVQSQTDLGSTFTVQFPRQKNL